MKRNLIFHAGCPDGFGAAWSARRAWGDDARYIPRSHDDDFDPERFEGELVVLADISLTNPQLRRLGGVAAELLVPRRPSDVERHNASAMGTGRAECRAYESPATPPRPSASPRPAR